MTFVGKGEWGEDRPLCMVGWGASWMGVGGNWVFKAQAAMTVISG